MFNLVQNWLPQTANPIGVDFGTNCLRMAQVQLHDGEPKLIAAASADLPFDADRDPAKRADLFVDRVRALLRQGDFRGRRIVLGLPAALTSIASLTLPRGDETATKATVSAAIREKLGINPDRFLLRHLLVNPKRQSDASATPSDTQDVIVIASSRAEVNRLVASAAKARLEIVGMNVESRAIVDCYSHVYRRASDARATTCIMDIGASATRMVAVRAGHILGTATIYIGGSDFDRAVSTAASISMEEAHLLRLKICHAQSQSETVRDKRELHRARVIVGPNAGPIDIRQERRMVSRACSGLREGMIQKLDQFRTRLAERFPANPIDRLVFAGGGAHDRSMCRSIARALNVSAFVGDPLLRMGRTSPIGFETGIDRREPQPAWMVAIGLSLGPTTASESGGSAAAGVAAAIAGDLDVKGCSIVGGQRSFAQPVEDIR